MCAKSLNAQMSNARMPTPARRQTSTRRTLRRSPFTSKMNKHGHLSEYHFRKLKNVSEAVKSVWGGAGGITSSKTN